MSQPPRGLGKGLSAILGNIPSADELRKPVGYENRPQDKSNPANVLLIPVDQIEPNPFQPRQTFDKDELDGLAASIKALGLITPITVRRISKDKFQIISGERRYRASQIAGLQAVPSYIREADDQGMLEMAIVENIQRSNLDPIETAISYQRLLQECNMTQEQMSERLGKSRSSLANQLRLLKLPVKVQHDLKVGQISVGHAKVLLSLEDASVQEKLCDLVIKSGMNVRQLEQKVSAILSASPSGEAPSKPSAKSAANMPQAHKDLCREASRYFKGKISIKRSQNGKGTLTINFTSDQEISTFLEAIKKR